jgi:DNA polymerase-3 subunit beta
MLNVICPRDALHEAIQVVSRGVTGRSTQPVQNNVYLETREGKLRLVATDLESISVEAEVDVEGAEPGAVTVPARLLSEIVGALPNADITLRADDSHHLLVSCMGTEEVVRGLAAGDFQMFPSMESGVRFTMPRSQLYWVVRQTVFAASRDETRPILTGVLMELRGDSLLMVATDTYRLAWRRTGLEMDLDAPVSAIVSARALNEVLRLLSADSSETVTVGLSESQVEFSVGSIRIASRLIEGQFPNYQKVIPESPERKLTVSVAALEPALRRALIVAREDANRVVLRSSGEGLELTAKTPDVGTFQEQVPAELDGEPTEIAFNARYLLDMLEAVDAQQIRLELGGPLNPGIARAEGNEDYLYVLMPMQIM